MSEKKIISYINSTAEFKTVKGIEETMHICRGNFTKERNVMKFHPMCSPSQTLLTEACCKVKYKKYIRN
jgi:hypothetical protein